MEYRCGQTSANALADFIDGKPVGCNPRGPDQYGRTEAVCAVSGVDLSDWLVRRGLAVDYAYFSRGKYRAAQDEASKARIGVWSGDFIESCYFRSCLKSGRLPPDCSSP
ncbi:thermonuclease family protein [Bradyrhizobium sp. Pa8]|uniref:thermonuclease family protein n=1 Tax=Bradyrhizobium sp. Pa8 TaxID=3386552 RepID=UPI00403F5222